MSKLSLKLSNSIRRKHRIRAKISGTTERPRLTVFISSRHISIQIIDDSTHNTLLSSTTVGQKYTGTLTDKATAIGTDIGKKAKQAKITQVVFDRNGRLYHGRIKALADAARAEGLEF